MKLFQLSTLLLATTLLVGCASTTGHHKCRNINWRHLGYQDGSHGKNKRDLQKDFADCGPNLVINKRTYDQGWQQGVRLYCTPRNGLSLGMRGKVYNTICPDNQIHAFDSAWKDGLRSYCIRSNGYTRGLEGKSFPGFCAPDLNVAFKNAYNRGHRIYQRLAKLKNHYEAYNKQVQKTKIEIQTKEDRLKALQKQFVREPFSPRKQYRIQKEKIQIKKLATTMDQLIEQRDATLQKYTAVEKRYENTGNL